MQRPLFGAGSHQPQHSVWQLRQGLNGDRVALEFDQISHHEKASGCTGNTQATPRYIPRLWLKHFRIDAIAQGGHLVPGRTQLHQAIRQCLGNADGALSGVGRCQDLSPGSRYFRNQVDVRTTGRHKKGLLQPSRQQTRGDAVWVVVVRVDEVKVKAFALQGA